MKILRLLPHMMATLLFVAGGSMAVNGQSDAGFIEKNIKDNQHEIEMSKMAIEKSSNPKIKNLAQQMVKDHTAILQDLRKLDENGGDNNMGVSGNPADTGTLSKPGDTGTAGNQPDMAGTRTSKSGDSSMNADMQPDSSNGNEAMMNATGKEFDEMWVSQMLEAHAAKLDELKSASQSLNNAQLKAAVQKAIPKVKMHKDRLEQLNKSSGKMK